MKPLIKIALILFVIGLVAAGGVYWYAFMRPHKDMLKTRPEFVMDASDLFNDFSNDENSANKKYLGKVVQITGKVIDVKNENNETAVTLEDELFGVSTYLDSAFVAQNPKLVSKLDSGQMVTLRGQCDGMLDDVVISRAVIIQ
ncbi:MAG TPA: hypothetical protein VKA27_03885 [Sunxiuqinia sp.]|nr:hypothetical protein [Sunxiuqinia sp.]